MIKKWLGLLTVAVGVSFTFVPVDADAKRLGGGKSQGMQRTAPDKPVQNTATPPTQAAPTAAPGTAAAAPAAAGTAAAAAASKRSWLGPIAGLAAGLGLAALFSSLGLGEELANFVMLALMAVAAFFLIRFLIARFADGAATSRMAPAAAGVGGNTLRQAPPVFVDERPGMQPSAQPVSAAPSVVIGSALQQPAGAARPLLPADFDAEGFERLAKMLFIRMQAANDTADLNDLRQFTTPELFAALRLDLQDRGDASQHTDVVKVDAQLTDFEQEADRQIVSVRYTGSVREDVGAEATSFDEVWHLVKPADDSRPWAIAGIQQQAQPKT
jgi:predicted lipid-binding transport protein (Tim44 family)